MNKVLIVGPSWVGDMVMAQSLFKVLKRAEPDTEITVLGPTWSIPILARMPEVGHTVDMPVGHGVLGLGVRRRLGRALMAANFDRAIVLPGSSNRRWCRGSPKSHGAPAMSASSVGGC